MPVLQSWPSTYCGVAHKQAMASSCQHGMTGRLYRLEASPSKSKGAGRIATATATIGHEPSKGAQDPNKNIPCQQKSPARNRGQPDHNPYCALWCPAVLCRAVHTHICLRPHREQPETASKMERWAWQKSQQCHCKEVHLHEGFTCITACAIQATEL